MKKQELEKLRIKSQKAQCAYLEAEEKHLNEEVIPKLKALIGKCFKYYNSYGGSLPRWYLYAKIISVDEKTCTLHTVEFQKTSLDKVEVNLKQKSTYRGTNYFLDNNGYIPISNTEYNRAKKFLKKFLIEKLEL